MRASRCPQCGAQVLWTVTEAGRRLPVDAAPDPAGNTAVHRDGTGAYRSRRPTAELPLTGWERLHTPHVATCTGPGLRAGVVPQTRRLPEGVADLAAHRRRDRGRGQP